MDLDQQQLTIQTASSRLGRQIIEIEGISKSYGEDPLFCSFSYHLLRDDRVGIIGPNGCGKSTLLKSIGGLLQPDSGFVKHGETVKLGYFSQECEEMDTSLRAIDYIKDIAPQVATAQGMMTATQMLELFLFDSSLQRCV